MSAGASEWVTPDRPPMVNIVTVPTANSIAVEKWSRRPHRGEPFRIFTPVGPR